MDTYIKNINPHEDLSLKIQPYNDWRYSNNFTHRQFQQFTSIKSGDKKFNSILCDMTNNQGQWCVAK
jgi:hypothetical protein